MIQIKWIFTCDVCGAEEEVRGRANAQPADETPAGYSFFTALWTFRNPAGTPIPVERKALCCPECVKDLTAVMAGKEASYIVKALIDKRDV